MNDGPTPDKLVSLLCEYGKSPEEAAAIVKALPAAESMATAAALGANELRTTNTGVVVACEVNAYNLLRAQFARLYFDEFLSRLRIDERDWTDADDLAALCFLQQNHNPRFTLGQARHGALRVGDTLRRDSLRAFIEALPAWDGVPRIELAFVDAWGAPDSELIRAAARNFFVALIARALQPGAKVDTLFVFEGPQGIGKSVALETLGGIFHHEITAPIGTADFMRELRGVWLAELSELDSLRGREASTVKRLLSAPADRFVQKYALHAESYPRRAVAVATTNEAAYWQDSTGARRLVPIRCGVIRLDVIRDNRLQWFAEAVHAYRAAATWWTFPAAIGEAQEARQQTDAWEDVLRDYIEHGRRAGLDGQGVIPWPDEPITSATIMADWLQLEPRFQGQASSTRLRHVMRRLGFEPVRIGREQARGWARTDTKSTDKDEVSG